MFSKDKIKLNNIVFEVTSACNLDCLHCYNHWKADFAKPQITNSYQLAFKTLKKIYKIATINQITFSGGEPLIAERFQEHILYARLKKSTVSIISNGMINTPYSTFKKLGVQLIQLPFHSLKQENHDKMMNNKNSWNMVNNSFIKLIDLNIQTVPVIVLTKINHTEIEKTLEFLFKTLNFNTIMINRFNIGGNGIKNLHKLLLSKNELHTAFTKAAETAIKYNLKLSSNVCTPHCILNPRAYAPIRFSSCSPEISKRPLTLDISGNIRFCNHSPTILGNIFTDKLKYIFETQQAKEWKVKIPDLCVECKLYPICMAGCRAASEQLNKTLQSEDPIIKLTT